MVAVLALDLRAVPRQRRGRALARPYRDRRPRPGSSASCSPPCRSSSCSTACATTASSPADMAMFPQRSRHAWRAWPTWCCCWSSSPASSSRPARPARPQPARPRHLGADLRHGGHRLRLPRHPARGAAAGGDGADRRPTPSSSAAARTAISTPTLEINGTPVRFMVDTGASDIVLSRRDAERVGIDPAALGYLGRARTANGTVPTARVRLGLRGVRRLHRHRRAAPASPAAGWTSRCSAWPTSTASPTSRSPATG